MKKKKAKKSKPRKSKPRNTFKDLNPVLSDSLKATVAIGVTGAVLKAVK